jgi:hypothetical protein
MNTLQKTLFLVVLLLAFISACSHGQKGLDGLNAQTAKQKRQQLEQQFAYEKFLPAKYQEKAKIGSFVSCTASVPYVWAYLRRFNQAQDKLFSQKSSQRITKVYLSKNKKLNDSLDDLLDNFLTEEKNSNWTQQELTVQLGYRLLVTFAMYKAPFYQECYQLFYSRLKKCYQKEQQYRSCHTAVATDLHQEILAKYLKKKEADKLIKRARLFY